MTGGYPFCPEHGLDWPCSACEEAEALNQAIRGLKKADRWRLRRRNTTTIRILEALRASLHGSGA